MRYNTARAQAGGGACVGVGSVASAAGRRSRHCAAAGSHRHAVHHSLGDSSSLVCTVHTLSQTLLPLLLQHTSHAEATGEPVVIIFNWLIESTTRIILFYGKRFIAEFSASIRPVLELLITNIFIIRWSICCASRRYVNLLHIFCVRFVIRLVFVNRE